jgi:dTDP-4-dehydrorhamnose reductase
MILIPILHIVIFFYFCKMKQEISSSTVCPVWVSGANGQLGRCIRDCAASTDSRYRFLFTDIAELDITDGEAVNRFLVENRVEVIINAAAYTAVDKAETDIAAATLLNSSAVAGLAQAARAHNTLLIHISTDYVFDGEATVPYTVESPLHPISVYGATKAAGEEAIRASGCRALIIRTSWLYSVYGHNFVKTVLQLGQAAHELRMVNDQFGAPTSAHDLAQAIISLLSYRSVIKDCVVLHYANEGEISWYDFACAIVELAGCHVVVAPVPTSACPTAARRPRYSVLDLSRIKTEFGITIPCWRDSLKQVVERLLQF